ncbi:hypothetical protein ABWK42_29835 [Bacillus sp. JJ927]|uniref:hypothetical protein n=1 Tax=Bacillus sp. JJ927 TaxID=3122976 RepID=UPI003392C7E5
MDLIRKLTRIYILGIYRYFCSLLYICTRTIVSLNSKISITKGTGVYDLTPILVHNPFQKLVVTNKQVETAIRVGVNVKK